MDFLKEATDLLVLQKGYVQNFKFGFGIAGESFQKARVKNRAVFHRPKKCKVKKTNYVTS